MTNALIITQYFPPDLTAASFRVGELASFLFNNSIDVEVLTTMPHKVIIDKEQNIFPEEKVHRININSNSHMKQYLQFIRKSKKKSRLFSKFDWIVISTPPISVFSIARKLRNETKVLLDVRDLWPDTPVAAGKMKKGIIYKYFKHYEKKMYQKSDYITVVSKPMANYINEIVPDKKVKVVYNGISSKDLENVYKRETVQDKRNQTNSLKIAYAGNIGLLQGLEIIPEALEFYQEKDFVFDFIGDGVQKDKLKKELSFDNRVSFINPSPREELLKHLRENTNVLFFNLKKDKILEKTIPSKLFDYLLCEKPIITGIKGEGREILNRTKATVFFKQDSPNSFINAIKEMKANYKIYLENAKKNNLNIVQEFTRENQFEKIKEILLSNEH